VVIVVGETKLLHVIDALRTPRSFSSRLDGGQQQSDKNANNRDDNQ
jgi:hypothetical protein